MSRTVTRTDLFVHDMVHNNPGLSKYTTAYNDPAFLKHRGYDGKVFDIFDSAQFGLLYDALDEMTGAEKVYPLGSEARIWAEEKKLALKKRYQEAVAAGLHVYFMMDMIVLPASMKHIYPEILNQDGKIDICAVRMQQILNCMFDEMFLEFPEIKGIYIRYGETYVGERFFTPHHFGNNPILKPEESYHKNLIRFLQEKICKQHDRLVFYRTWGFGAFQYDMESYQTLSEQIEPHPNFLFCIKHTAGDFHRTFEFNQSLGVGRHRQVVEVQAAREYEGKGAYPNYVADGVINGYEEFKWKMKQHGSHCLRDVVNRDDSIIAGIWTWSRGGGWDGPYINGKNGKNGARTVEKGSELWTDVNAYVISHWAKDTSRSDKFYALQYAREELNMAEKDTELFYEILLLSARAVLLGRGCNNDRFSWDVFWTRDQNIEYARLINNIKQAVSSDSLDLLLDEKARSVVIWEQIELLAARLEDSVTAKGYIMTTCTYGRILYQLYEVLYRANALAIIGGHIKEVKEQILKYDVLWENWHKLYRNAQGCPTLYEKENKLLDLIGYNWNRGFDCAIDPLRSLSSDGKFFNAYESGCNVTNAWGLSGSSPA